MSTQLPKTDHLVGQRRNIDQAYLLLLALALGIIGGAITFVLVLPSWKPRANMEKQAYNKPYSESAVFADDMSERPLMAGVVPRPAHDSPGIPYVSVRSTGPALFPDVAASQNIPMPITRALLEHGQEQFTIYCSPCHSDAGDGDGMIVRRGFYSPPSYYIPRLVNKPDAYFYNVITNGYGTMLSYSERVAPNDRWAIVAYIRAMQLAMRQHPALNAQFQHDRGVQR